MKTSGQHCRCLLACDVIGIHITSQRHNPEDIDLYLHPVPMSQSNSPSNNHS